MKKNGIEKNLVVLLFVLVLVVFSFAERDSRKLERMYKTAQLIKNGASAMAAKLPPPAANNINN